jgi:hypothetical protein
MAFALYFRLLTSIYSGNGELRYRHANVAGVEIINSTWVVAQDLRPHSSDFQHVEYETPTEL